MIATVALIELFGYVILLLWGMRMVQSGVSRAFGSKLRHVIGRTLRNRFAAMTAGLAVTALLQSSTATAMMTTSLAADGTVALVPALAVMLGANVGTALIVKVLSFDVSWVSPLLVIAGYVAFRRGRKGRVHDLGRVGIGLGLMLLSLHLLVVTIEPVQTAPVLGQLLGVLTREPLLDLALAALLTWAAHSSVAVMLLLVSLAAGNVITPVAAIALVLGANLGGTIPPLLEAPRADPPARRLPVGNFAFRAIGCVVALPFARPIAETLRQLNPDPAASVANFHIAFNFALAMIFVGLLDPAASLLTRAMPDRRKRDDPAQPLYLEEAVLDTPYLALTNASREALRMADLVEMMLQQLMKALTRNDQDALKSLARTGKALDRVQEALKAYLTQLGTDGLSETDAQRHSLALDLAVNLGHAGDIIERSLADAAARKAKRGLILTTEDEADLVIFHTRVLEDLKLVASTFMTADLRSAQHLLEAKRQLNAMERAIGRHHLARLETRQPGGLEASTLYLAILRDLRRVNSHISAIAYDVLGLPDSPEVRDEPIADAVDQAEDGAASLTE
jgi:phosphate:Na+ symporter